MLVPEHTSRFGSVFNDFSMSWPHGAFLGDDVLSVELAYAGPRHNEVLESDGEDQREAGQIIPS